MFERFTDRARRVLVLAQDDARLLDHPFIGTEHILLGLLREQDGIAARAMRSLGMRVEDARQEIVKLIGMGGSEVRSAPAGFGSPPFTTRAKRVFELALRESLQLEQRFIGTEHLLLGIVREGEGVAARVIVNSGVDPKRLRQQVLDLMAEERQGPQRSGDEESAGDDNPAGSPPTRERPASNGPRCATCRSDMATTLRYVTVHVPAAQLPGGASTAALSTGPAAGPAVGPAVPATILFCSHCGRVVGSGPAEP